MPYIPIEWTTETLITARRMRVMETQYEQAVADAGTSTRSSTTEIRSEIRTGNPATPNIGRFYYNSTTGKMVGWNGTTWTELIE